MGNKAKKYAFFTGFVALASSAGAFLSRWHGGGFIHGTPKILKNFLWALPFALISLMAVWGQEWWKCAVLTLISLTMCMIGKATGHGGGMDLAHSQKEPDAGRTPEKLEYLILWLHGKMPQYWYDALLLAIVGFAAVSGAALVVGWYFPAAGAIIAVGGVLKALGYIIGHAIDDNIDLGAFPDDLNVHTEIGELLTGFMAYICLSIATLMVLTAKNPQIF